MSNGGQLAAGAADPAARQEVPDVRMQDGVMLLLPSVPGLSAHPYKGTVQRRTAAR